MVQNAFSAMNVHFVLEKCILSRYFIYWKPVVEIKFFRPSLRKFCTDNIVLNPSLNINILAIIDKPA